MATRKELCNAERQRIATLHTNGLEYLKMNEKTGFNTSNNGYIIQKYKTTGVIGNASRIGCLRCKSSYIYLVIMSQVLQN